MNLQELFSCYLLCNSLPTIIVDKMATYFKRKTAPKCQKASTVNFNSEIREIKVKLLSYYNVKHISFKVS